jgi:hypothetical protein
MSSEETRQSTGQAGDNPNITLTLQGTQKAPSETMKSDRWLP